MSLQTVSGSTAVRITKAAVKLDHIACASIADFYEPDGRLTSITPQPAHLAEAVREVDEDGRPKRIRLHDKLAVLIALLKHLGGFLDERPAEVTNYTVNLITMSSVLRR